MSQSEHNPKRNLSTTLLKRWLFAPVAAVIILVFVIPQARQTATDFLFHLYVYTVGYEKVVREMVQRRSEDADAEVLAATTYPDPVAVENLRQLLRKHSKASPPSEDDKDWVYRIRTLRALARYDKPLQARALPELLYLLRYERGYTPLEIRDIIIALGCDALPASEELVEIIKTGDSNRVDLATSILFRLSFDCQDQFAYNEAVTRAILTRVRDPLKQTSFPGELLSNLRLFDKEGKVSSDTLEEILSDPNTSADLKENAQRLRWQMGLEDRSGER